MAAASFGFARDYAAIGERWARDVVKGKIVACKLVKAACQRHLSDLDRAKTDKTYPFEFDRWHAGDVCDFIEKLPHVQGVWETPTLRLEPVQIFILTTVFGWRRKTDGLRRFTDVYIEMARKGAKSTLTAGVGIYCLCCEGEVGPQVYVGATTGAQALKVFEPMQGMVRKTHALREAFGLQVWAKSIVCADNDGFIQTINSKGSTQDGHNPHCVILDELHAHKDRALYDVMKSALGARKNPMMWVITTAGFNTQGVCYEQRLYVAKILEGVLEAEHYFGIIFTLDEGDDPFNERNWIKANPMLGVTPTLQKMRQYAADARASPSSEGNFLTKNLNKWLNALAGWLSPQAWAACADPALDWSDFDGLECYIGADLADKDDITAAVLAAFRPSPTLAGQTQLIIKSMFWLPDAVLQDPKHGEGKGPAPYRTWSKTGPRPGELYLNLTPGDWVDHDEVEGVIRGWIDRYSATRMATFDQFAAAQAMASRLNADLGTPDRPIARILHKKAAAVTDPAKELEARLKGGPERFLHDDNPVMNWMASNVVIARRRDETILPIKETQDSPNKIDGIDALINAIEPAITPQPEAKPASYLESRPILSF